MRRSITYCRWKAAWWIQQQVARALKLPEGDPICEGMEAYAKQQAAHELMLASSWAERWLPVRQRARPLLVKLLGESLPEGLDVGEVTTDTVVLDLEDVEIDDI